jgi:hypothetical protein
MAEEIILEINSLVVGVNAHDKRVYSTIFMLSQIFFFARFAGFFGLIIVKRGSVKL